MRALILMPAFILLLCLPAAAQALPASAQREITRATLVSEYDALLAGESAFLAGLLLEPKEGWHTYWENPGDAGIATSLVWTLPEGFSVSPIDWPAPQRLPEGPLVTYGYEGAVLLPVTLRTPPINDRKSYTLKVKAEWLVCKDICIPESAELEILLPVASHAGERVATPHAALFERHGKSKPALLTAAGHYQVTEKEIALAIPLPETTEKTIASAYFFPRGADTLRYDARQRFSFESGLLRLTAAAADRPPEGEITGILSVTYGGGATAHFDVALTPGTLTAAGEPLAGFALALLLAMAGGLILNLMPCVLPVLSLKALAIAKKAGGEHALVVRQGIAYTLGILVSFALIAGVLIGLQQGGEAVGWGYQMQSPAFVGFLAYLLFAVGLSLSGLFHLPVLLGNVGVGLPEETSTRASFLTGVLAAAVATPCTAPFMAPAVGVALTLPPLQALLIFEALGFGLALPFLAISLFPRLRRFLPKPGAWMETFKKILALPMYASVAWLLWVLTLQTGAVGLLLALAGMAVIALALRMEPRRVPLLMLLALPFLALPVLGRLEITEAQTHDMAEAGVETVSYSKETLDRLRAEGKPVFIDATAAWCITCQVNARIAIHTDRTMDAFKRHGVTLMIADWTRRNAEITAFLSGFGYSGVPLYVFYPPRGGKPIVLPQLLTEDIVIDAITPKEGE